MDEQELNPNTVHVDGPQGSLPVPRWMLRLLAREVGHKAMRALWDDEEALQAELLALRSRVRLRWLKGEGIDGIA